MRPVKQRFDPGRSGRERKVVSKYIIVTEGYRTEQKYFEAICKDRRISGISGLVEVVVLQRERIDSGLSHPLTLLNLLDEYMRCVRCRRYSYRLLLEVTTDSLAIASDITRNSEAVDEFRRTVESGTNGFVDEDGFVDNVPGFVRACSDTSKTMFGIPLNIVPPELIDSVRKPTMYA